MNHLTNSNDAGRHDWSNKVIEGKFYQPVVELEP